MEWSVHISGVADLDGALDLDHLCGLETSARIPKIAPLLRALFGNITFTRCAFGTEFCENLLPEPAALAVTRKRARACGVLLTFLTPYVSDRGIAQLKPLLALLDGGDEVAFNDWGVLNLLRRDYPRLVPVQGRLLNKSLRDPRVMGVYGESSA